MKSTTIESVSGMDIRFFSEQELLSLKDEIERELKKRELSKDTRIPLDLFAQQARRDVCCPVCDCHRYSDDGIHNGRQRLLCSQCGTRFSFLSGKMMEGSKLSLMRICQLVTLLVLDLPAWTISYLSGTDQKTVKFWRYRLSDVASSYLEKTVLSDRLWIDETYWKLTDHGLIRVHPDGKSLRDLSDNLVCVVVGYDIHGRYYCHVMDKRGKPDSDGIYDALKSHIRSGSLVIHDGAKEHRRLIEALRLKETIIKSYETDKDRRIL